MHMRKYAVTLSLITMLGGAVGCDEGDLKERSTKSLKDESDLEPCKEASVDPTPTVGEKEGATATSEPATEGEAPTPTVSAAPATGGDNGSTEPVVTVGEDRVPSVPPSGAGESIDPTPTVPAEKTPCGATPTDSEGTEPTPTTAGK